MLKAKLRRVGFTIAWAVVLPFVFVVCVIMLAGFLMSAFLDEQLYGITEDQDGIRGDRQ